MGLTTKRELAAIIVAHNALDHVIALADEDMLEKTRLKIFPVAKGGDLCNSFDAVVEHIDGGVSAAEGYADAIVREIMRQNPKHIKNEILEAS